MKIGIRRKWWICYSRYVPPVIDITNLGADTEGKAGLADPLAALEKTTKVQIPRPEALQGISDHYGNDPYALSSLVRKHFRIEKKIEARGRAEDDTLKGRYGLPEDLKLIEDDAEASIGRRMNRLGLEWNM